MSNGGDPYSRTRHLPSNIDPPKRWALVGMGTYADVVKVADGRVLKLPKIYPEDSPGLANCNSINHSELVNEIAVYERLGVHDGIVHRFGAHEGSIELELASDGDLEKYIQSNPEPSRACRQTWVRSLADAFAHVHARRVVVQDVALRNILVHHASLKLCDFGESSLLPLGTDMADFCDCGTTPQIEMLHVGCIFYSISAWTLFEYDYFHTGRWPEASKLPSTVGVSFAKVIQNCWSGSYASMEALREDVSRTKDE